MKKIIPAERDLNPWPRTSETRTLSTELSAVICIESILERLGFSFNNDNTMLILKTNEYVIQIPEITNIKFILLFSMKN